MSAITIYKRNYLGEVVWHYKGVVTQRGDSWICLRAVFEPSAADLGFVVFRRGDIFTEWFYSDRWYNIFRVEDGQSGQLKGWYCNITRPALILHDSVGADDLALDVFVMPDGKILLLDEDEFEALSLSTSEHSAALEAVETIRQMVARCAPPFEDVGYSLSG